VSDPRQYFDPRGADWRDAAVRLAVVLALIAVVRLVIWPEMNGLVLVVLAIVISSLAGHAVRPRGQPPRE